MGLQTTGRWETVPRFWEFQFWRNIRRNGYSWICGSKWRRNLSTDKRLCYSRRRYSTICVAIRRRPARRESNSTRSPVFRLWLQVISVIMKHAIWLGLVFLAGLATMWIVSFAQRENRLVSLRDGYEQIRLIAPDDSNMAFVWVPKLGPLGATMSQPYQVWIARQHSAKEKRMILEADDWVLLAWHGPALLEICYSEAQIGQFHNRFVAVDRSDELPKFFEVEIILKKVSNQDDCSGNSSTTQNADTTAPP